MKPIIRATNVAKQYEIGSSRDSYTTLRDTLAEIVRSPLKPFRAKPSNATIMALRDLSFEVTPGEVVGIIGRNGSGKSTLLKVLSRITAPSSGRIDLRGRVASLLEVGTGFHPELTGRENIHLNGAILGMSRGEILQRFDEIVTFSEIERFIDTPVKRYSSGMYLRLAFAIAAHLDPEILLVDEVLAVGDSGFQRKCLNKMDDVRSAGRTVLFVSHNMPAVIRLCPRTIVLESGNIIYDGPSHEAIGFYLGSGMTTNAAREWTDPNDAPGNDVARLRSIRVRNRAGESCECVDIHASIGIEMEFEVLQPGHVLVPNYHFINQEGVCVFVAAENAREWHRRPRPKGRYVTTAWIPGNFLAEGTLLVETAVSTMDPAKAHFFEREVVAFQVADNLNNEGNTARGDYGAQFPGVVRPLLEWESQQVASVSSY